VSHLYSRIPKLKHLLVGSESQSGHRSRFTSPWPAGSNRSVLCSVLKVCSTDALATGGGVVVRLEVGFARLAQSPLRTA
jgi:hypothetical protein